MLHNDIAAGRTLDDDALTIDELAHACAVSPDWVVEHVQAGFFSDGSFAISTQRFTSIDLKRARRIIDLERRFGAEPELAALMADMLEEVDRLRAKLKAAGVDNPSSCQ